MTREQTLDAAVRKMLLYFDVYPAYALALAPLEERGHFLARQFFGCVRETFNELVNGVDRVG